MVEVCSAWNRATGVRVTWTGLRAFLTCRAVLQVITPVIERNNGGLTMRYSGRDQQTGGRRVAASHRTVAGGWFGPGVVSPGMGVGALERGRGRAAGLSRAKRAPGVLFSFAGGICLPRPGRRCGGTRPVPASSGARVLAMRRRADGGPASAANPGNGTGRREPGRVRVRSLAARGLARRASRGLRRAPCAALSGPGAEQCADLRRWHGHVTGVQRDDRRCDGDDSVGHRSGNHRNGPRTPATRSNTPWAALTLRSSESSARAARFRPRLTRRTATRPKPATT